ncbi:hypothetical protein GOP47_0001290 [Adiantum capillus-veneris]|uniref:Bulb-type lectin domain-containing protein n=1 Tax=Adiantum capillus-veneris TaxID=13818 RepID=A0A9D4ZPV5_ADICA|nr:hypothetical protein GOP47_0001290 [Adiantum capillus-veneris]
MIPGMAAPSRLCLLMITLPFIILHAHALTNEQGRQGDLSDTDAQEEAIHDIEDHVTAPIDSDQYYGPGFISALDTDISDTLRLHTSLMLHNTGECFGEGLGAIIGYDLVQAWALCSLHNYDTQSNMYIVFVNNMLDTIRNQIRNGFGFGVVVEGAGDQNLVEEGLSAQFYYWVERIGASDDGAATPNTGEAEGDSDNNSDRHDELSVVTGVPQRKRSSLVNQTTNSLSTNTTYQRRPSQHRHILHSNSTNNISRASFNASNTTRIISREDGLIDCPPWYNGLFTSNYDINVLVSTDANTDYPDLIYSPNEQYYLVMQDDCNLVLYHAMSGGTNKPIWACPDSKCFRHGSHCYARINLDGTFAVYNSNGKPLWWTPTQCTSGPGCWSRTYLVVQDDGNLVLYLQETGEAIWASGTDGQ